MYHNDRDEGMSSKKREEIESEVRSYVDYFPASRCLHFTRLFASDVGSDGKGPLIPFSDSFRILKAGEKRASELLKEKEVELHRVSNLRLLFPADFLMINL